MLKFILRRFLNYLVLVFLATSMAYLLASLTLNPAKVYYGGGKHINLASIQHTLNYYNINPHKPLLGRYVHWLDRVLLHADFGKVFQTQTPITTEMGRRILVSLRLLLVGSILAVVFGVLMGVYSALRQYKVSDHVLTLFSFIALSMPVFLLGTLVKHVSQFVNDQAGTTILPSDSIYTSASSGYVDQFKHLVLPTIVLIAGPAGAAFFSRYQRSAMLDVLGSDFIRTAQAKGLSRRRAFYKHGLRTALIPMATFFAFQFGLLITGAVFTESIFNWHGMGEWSVTTIQNSDVNAVTAITAFVAVMVLISSTLSDIFYAVLDPRVRVG